jgi:methylated-DNA-[protein]-cysteine S-methyltransferase
MAILYREFPFRIIEILLPRENPDELNAYIGKSGAAGFHPNAELVAEAICEYFEGKIIGIPWEWMDMSNLTEQQQSVLKSVAHIPYGQVRSYKEIAEEIGKPRASRFVGTSVAQNPFPILIPCHRVVRSDGSIGQFGGGSEMKQQLIDMEQNFLKRT